LKSISGFWKAILVTFSGGIASRLVTLVSMAVCAKYFFSQADIGYWGTLFAVAMFIAPLATWRYELAIVLPKSTATAKQVAYGTALLVLVLTAIIAFSILIGVPDYYADRFIAIDIVYFLPLLVFAQNIRKVAEYWLIRIREFRAIAYLELTQSLLIAAFCIGFGWALSSHIKIFSIANFIAIVLGSFLFLYFALRKGMFKDRHTLSLKSSVAALKEYRAYPLFVTPYSISNGLNQHAFVILLSSSFGASLAGAFVLASRLVYSPALLLVMPIRQVFFSYGSGSEGVLDDDSKKRLKLLVYFLALTVPPVAISLSEILHWLLTSFLGSEFSEATTIVKVLVLGAFANILTGWLDRLYDLLNRQRLSVVLQVTLDIFKFLIILGMVFLGYSGMTVVYAYAVLLVLTEVFWLVARLTLAGWAKRSILHLSALLVGTSALAYGVLRLSSTYLSDIYLSGALVLFMGAWMIIAALVFYLANRQNINVFQS